MSKQFPLVPDENMSRIIADAIQAFNKHDLDRWMNFYALDAVHYQPGLEKPLRGWEQIREDYLSATWDPFPDFHFSVELVFSQADWVCVRGTLTGTNQGELPGDGGKPIPPTGRSIRIPLCLVVQMQDGKAVEVYEYNDRLELLTQLGLLD